jgi:hypothetical protein
VPSQGKDREESAGDNQGGARSEEEYLPNILTPEKRGEKQEESEEPQDSGPGKEFFPRYP